MTSVAKSDTLPVISVTEPAPTATLVRPSSTFKSDAAADPAETVKLSASVLANTPVAATKLAAVSAATVAVTTPVVYPASVLA